VLKSIVFSAILTVATLAVSTPLAAQTRSAVTSTALDSAILAAPATSQETVQRFLQDSRVSEIAASMGVKTADLAAIVSSLDEALLAQLADRTRAADRDLAGGDTVVISTTAIIIVLLILILLSN
jgi:hypothetical protein